MGFQETTRFAPFHSFLDQIKGSPQTTTAGQASVFTIFFWVVAAASQQLANSITFKTYIYII